MHRLRGGEIVALDDQYRFCSVSRAATTCWQLVLFLILLSPSDAIAGYRPDHFYCYSLAFPVFIWMRPHWQDMLKLKQRRNDLAMGISMNVSTLMRFEL